MSSFGDRLRAARQAAGQSLDELCRRSGVSHSYLWKLEKGYDGDDADRPGAGLSVLRSLAGALGVTVGHLAGDGGLESYSTDQLLNELRRRIDHA